MRDQWPNKSAEPNRIGASSWAAPALTLLMFIWSASAQSESNSGTYVAILKSISGIVQYKARDWTNFNEVASDHKPYLNAHDTIRTKENSSAVVLLASQNCSIRLGELSTLEILPAESNPGPLLNLAHGALYYFGWQRFHDIQIRTPHGTGAPRGTEFVMTVEPDRTLIAMFDGVATLTNEFGQTNVVSGEIGIARAGQAPVTMRLEAKNIVQWWLYYPGVLDIDELDLNPAEKRDLAASLVAYKSGDLPAALSGYPGYPTPSKPVTDPGKIYLAALLLGNGEVAKAEELLGNLQTNSSQAESLRWLIAAVQHRSRTPPQVHTSASEWLGLSYYYQARHDLDQALAAAKQSVALSTNFAFGWERVAELEFGFGRVAEAKHALEISMPLAPKNAEAHALNGFLFSAENNLSAATREFDESIRLDPDLGNGWLGRGLVRIRKDDTADGRTDLKMAAILEPNRSLLRSYLGKAFADTGKVQQAAQELRRATLLDTNDPTPWLYSALLKQQENQINGAIGDMQKSQSLNYNRQLFRSKLLLDQDEAVRGANLATMYNDEGMTEAAVREAAKAVTCDYDDASAHLLLSDSYDNLRDPTAFDLRYETAWFNELLLANLLAPVGAGRLSQTVSKQEYSKLFQQDGFGAADSFQARSDGMYSEQASQFGTFGNTAYALDLDYHHNNGVRVNNDLDSIDWYSTVKQQIMPKDTAMVMVEYYNYHSGDNFQYYYQTNAMPHYRLDEYQTPTVVAGWHHEWAPGVDTLLLGGRLADDQRIDNASSSQLLLIQNPSGNIVNYDTEPFGVDYKNQLQVYTLELNQIFQWDRFTLVAGSRYQSGTIDTQMTFTNPPGLVPFLFPNSADATSETGDFRRTTGYGYFTVEPLERIWLMGGLSYDTLYYPQNYRNPPLTSGQDHRSQTGPKAAVVWEMTPQVTFRGIFTHSLGGVSLDESFRLEPTELAGFPQTFRSLIPESVAGSVSAPAYEIYGGAMDFKFSNKTYAGLQVEELDSKASRTDGVFMLADSLAPYVPASTVENLDYRETTVRASVNQLLGRDLAAGTSYTYDQVKLGDVLSAVPVAAYPAANQQNRAVLQELGAYILFNHPSGFFARADATWYFQHNSGYSPGLPTSGFVQANIYCGYRFWNRRCEIQGSILNLGGGDYHLNPLNTYAELPRSRTYTMQLKFIF